jgi:dipeptidyl aminopeptidase/acylaminoacyl peptidase
LQPAVVLSFLLVCSALPTRAGEAEQIVNTLKQRGVPVEYILFPDEGHGWRKTPNRIRSIAEEVSFFDAHLKASQ